MVFDFIPSQTAIEIYISDLLLFHLSSGCHSSPLFPGLSGHPTANMGKHSIPYLYIGEVKSNKAHVVLNIKTKSQIFCLN